MCSREGSNFAKLSRPYETRRNDACHARQKLSPHVIPIAFSKMMIMYISHDNSLVH